MRPGPGSVLTPTAHPALPSLWLTGPRPPGAALSTDPPSLLAAQGVCVGAGCAGRRCWALWGLSGRCGAARTGRSAVPSGPCPPPGVGGGRGAEEGDTAALSFLWGVGLGDRVGTVQKWRQRLPSIPASGSRLCRERSAHLMLLYTHQVIPWNHGMVWVGKNLTDHLVPTPSAIGRDIFN